VKGGSAVNDYDVIVIGTGIAGGPIHPRPRREVEHDRNGESPAYAVILTTR